MKISKFFSLEMNRDLAYKDHFKSNNLRSYHSIRFWHWGKILGLFFDYFSKNSIFKNQMNEKKFQKDIFQSSFSQCIVEILLKGSSNYKVYKNIEFLNGIMDYGLCKEVFSSDSAYQFSTNSPGFTDFSDFFLIFEYRKPINIKHKITLKFLLSFSEVYWILLNFYCSRSHLSNDNETTILGSNQTLPQIIYGNCIMSRRRFLLLYYPKKPSH